MKKLLLFFLFISSFVFGQKQLYKSVTYNDLITFYNEKLKLTGEDLPENIERCKFIIAESNKNNDDNTGSIFSILLKGLIKAQNNSKDSTYIAIYKDNSSYNFYDDENNFVGRIYKEKFEEDIEIKGNKTETFIESYYYLLQE